MRSKSLAAKKTGTVAKIVRVMTCLTMKDTGMISYMFTLEAPREWMDFCNNFGVLKRSKKDGNHLDPWKLAGVLRGELPRDTQFVGDDGVARWNLNIFNGDGLVVGSGWDDGGLPAMERAFEGFPESCILLMLRSDFDDFEKACKAQGVDLDVRHHAGELRTS